MWILIISFFVVFIIAMIVGWARNIKIKRQIEKGEIEKIGRAHV